jgi:hypothetical protein
MPNQLFYSQIDAARELCAGSTYRLKQLRDAGILDAPVTVEGIKHPVYSYEQIRSAKNRAARIAYAPAADIKPVKLSPGEEIAR